MLTSVHHHVFTATITYVRLIKASMGVTKVLTDELVNRRQKTVWRNCIFNIEDDENLKVKRIKMRNGENTFPCSVLFHLTSFQAIFMTPSSLNLESYWYSPGHLIKRILLYKIAKHYKKTEVYIKKWTHSFFFF